MEILIDIVKKGLETKYVSIINDNNATIHIEIKEPTRYATRCTMKVTFVAGEDAMIDYIKAIKGFFK